VSGHRRPPPAQLLGSLQDLSLAEAVGRFHHRVATYLADKQTRVAQGTLSELEHFPCWYCLHYLGKTSWLDNFPEHAWADEPCHTGAERSHVHVKAARPSAS
jgi:hypothetical protein